MLIVKDILEKSRQCYGVVTAKTVIKACLTDGTAAMVYYRLSQWSRKWRLEPLAMFFGKLSAIFCGCVIGRGAEFGPGLVIMHSNGVVINGRVRGGERIVVEHQVTIGVEKNQSPHIGNNVFIGAGAKIVGGVQIGDDVQIGANAVVVKDVPSGATAVGIPAKVVRLYGKRIATPSEIEATEELESANSVTASV